MKGGGGTQWVRQQCQQWMMMRPYQRELGGAGREYHSRIHRKDDELRIQKHRIQCRLGHEVETRKERRERGREE
jgi:hypothetical protein